MRKTIYSLLKNVHPDIPPERWYQMGSVAETPVKPFGVYRLAVTVSGVTARSKYRPTSLEVWVHDEPGSYTRIDGILTAVESLAASITYASAAFGESISAMDFSSRGPDLDDSGFRSICKMSNFRIIGKGQ